MLAGQYCAANEKLPDSPLKVLVIHSDDGSAADLRTKLLSFASIFGIVDFYQAQGSVPSLTLLKQYHAVIFYAWYQFAYPDQLGNVLADFWDADGAVVVAWRAPTRIAGKFGTAENGYMLLNGTSNFADSSSTMGAVPEPASPLMIGVSAMSFPDPSLKIMGASTTGTVVASWAGGSPFIIRGKKAGRNLVFLNFYVVSRLASSGGWTGDGANLLRNAVLFALCQAPAGARMSDPLLLKDF